METHQFYRSFNLQPTGPYKDKLLASKKWQQPMGGSRFPTYGGERAPAQFYNKKSHLSVVALVGFKMARSIALR